MDKAESEVKSPETDQPSESSDQVLDVKVAKKQKRIIWKNVIFLSISFSTTAFAYQSLLNSQSSLNPVAGLGVASLTVSYCFTIIAGLILSSLMVRKKGTIWTIAACMFCHIVYAVANMYPSWFTLIPTSVIVGAAAGPLWTAQSTYLATSALEYCKITGRKKGPVLSHFFGMFSIIYLSGAVFGNVLMSIILKPPDVHRSHNETMAVKRHCGAQDCPRKFEKLSNGTMGEVADQESVIILMCTFAGAFFLSGMIVIMLVGSIKSVDEGEEVNIKSHLSAVLKMSFKDKRMLFLLPIQVYAGLIAGFVAVDYSKSFASCSLGIENLGFVLCCFAAGQAAFSIVIGKIERLIGRRILMVAFYIITVSMFVLLLEWNTQGSAEYFFYAASFLFGVIKCVWRTETNSFTAVLCQDNLATGYALVRVCTSLGYLVSFGWGYYLCVYAKIYFHIAFLTVAILCYFVTEYLEHKRKKFQADAKRESGMEL